MRKAFRRSTAVALIAAATIATAPAAQALTIPGTPPDGRERNTNFFWSEVNPASLTVISPYQGRIRSRDGADHSSVKFQQRTDGQWQALAPVIPNGNIYIYPVWEDPASLNNLIPQHIRNLLPR